MMPKAQVTKARIYKRDYIKVNSFHTPQKTTNKMKIPSVEREKIFASHISNKELVSQIYNIKYAKNKN